MRVIKLHKTISSLSHMWKISFMCYFFVFFIFRNDFGYLLQQAIDYTQMSVNYDLWDDGLSSEVELEKQEVILSDIFSGHLQASLFVEEQTIKNPIACCCNVLSVYLEVLSPPPWAA